MVYQEGPRLDVAEFLADGIVDAVHALHEKVKALGIGHFVNGVDGFKRQQDILGNDFHIDGRHPNVGVFALHLVAMTVFQGGDATGGIDTEQMGHVLRHLAHLRILKSEGADTHV